MRVVYAGTETPPGISASVILFDSFVAFKGVPIDTHELTHHVVTFTNSAAITTLQLLSLDASGNVTGIVSSAAVAIPTGPATATRTDFPIDGLTHYRVLLNNAGTAQDATWKISQEITERQRAALT